MSDLTCNSCVYFENCKESKENPCNVFFPNNYNPDKANLPDDIYKHFLPNYRSHFLEIVKHRYRLEKAGYNCIDDFKKILEVDPNEKYDNNFYVSLDRDVGGMLDLWVLYQMALKIMPGYVDDIVLAKIWENDPKEGLNRAKKHKKDIDNNLNKTFVEIGKVLKANYELTKDISKYIQETNKSIVDGTKTTTDILTKTSLSIVSTILNVFKKKD